MDSKDFEVTDGLKSARPVERSGSPRGARPNYALRFILLMVSSMTITLVAVAWLGQIYTHSDDPMDAVKFFGALALVALNFAYFMWSNRGWQD